MLVQSCALRCRPRRHAGKARRRSGHICRALAFPAPAAPSPDAASPAFPIPRTPWSCRRPLQPIPSSLRYRRTGKQAPQNAGFCSQAAQCGASHAWSAPDYPRSRGRSVLHAAQSVPAASGRCADHRPHRAACCAACPDRHGIFRIQESWGSSPLDG